MRRAARTADAVLRSIGAPYPRHVWIIVRRSAVTWVMVRLAFAVAFVMMGLGSVALHPPWSISVALVGITPLLVWLDRYRSHELLLPADLGTCEIWFWCASALSAALLDAGSRALLAAR